MKPCIVGIWKADPCKMPQGYEFGTWGEAQGTTEGYTERDHQREKAWAVSTFSCHRFNRYARLKGREV